MDLTLAPEDLKFRDEVRAFLKTAITPDMRRDQALTTGFASEPEVALPFHQALLRKGWSVHSWPKDFGGTGWSAVQAYIFENECARAGAPVYNGAGQRMRRMWTLCTRPIRAKKVTMLDPP